MNEEIVINVFKSHNETERVPYKRKRNNSIPNKISFKNEEEVKMFSEKTKTENLSAKDLSFQKW